MSFLLTMMKQAVVAIMNTLDTKGKRGYKYIIIILMSNISIKISKSQKKKTKENPSDLKIFACVQKHNKLIN